MLLRAKTPHSQVVLSLFPCYLALICTLLPVCGWAAAPAQAKNISSIRVLLIPRIETTFSSEIAASINKLSVDFGDNFAKGQDLISFDCRRYRAELTKAKAELAEAAKTHEVNAKLERLQSVSELDVAVSKARKDRAKAEVKLKEVEVDKCQVKAPFAGRVLKRAANKFQFVVPGQPLLEVIGKASLLQLFVPSSWLAWIKTGQEFSIFIDETKQRYGAKITVLGAKVDQVSQTIEVRAKITGHHPELLAGMSGTAYFNNQ